MKYYKVNYKIGKTGDYAYPGSVANVIWNVTQYHGKNKVMIGGTDSDLKADGKQVAALTEKDALRLIEEYRKSYPERADKAGPG